MKIFIIIFLMFISSYSMAASVCPKLDGVYENVALGNLYTMTFTQKNCESLNIHYVKSSDGEVLRTWDRTFIADGIFREGIKDAKFISAEASYFTGEKFFISGVTYMMRESGMELISDQESYELNADGDLVNVMSSFEGDGATRYSDPTILIRKK